MNFGGLKTYVRSFLPCKTDICHWRPRQQPNSVHWTSRNIFTEIIQFLVLLHDKLRGHLQLFCCRVQKNKTNLKSLFTGIKILKKSSLEHYINKRERNNRKTGRRSVTIRCADLNVIVPRGLESETISWQSFKKQEVRPKTGGRWKKCEKNKK